jgi:hypothetical protein
MKKLLPLFILILIVLGCQQREKVQTPANAPTVNSEAKNEYLKFIEIRNAKTEKGVLGDDGIFAELKNTGNKTVKRVAVRAFLLDKDGKTIAEEDYTPIFEGAFREETSAPLKPNYSRKFGFKINPPSDWSKKFNLSVIEVETEN